LRVRVVGVLSRDLGEVLRNARARRRMTRGARRDAGRGVATAEELLARRDELGILRRQVLRLLLREIDAEGSHVRIGKLLRGRLHDRVDANARLEMRELAADILRALSGEVRIRRGSAVAVGTVACGTDRFRRLLGLGEIGLGRALRRGIPRAERYGRKRE